MSIKCGSQAIICDLPVRFDNYQGCTHLCKYCFVYKKYDISNVKLISSVSAVEKWIKGWRPADVKWMDWNIPLHWGGMSDPFQPLERKMRSTLQHLKLFAAYNYPLVISTKGTSVLNQPEYLSVLKEANAVIQVSALCEGYDAYETGAPTFNQRLKDIENIVKYCKRVIIRCQPYHPDIFSQVLKNIPRFKDAGAYGVVIEGMKYKTKRPGTEKFFGDNVFKLETLKKHFEIIKTECHKNGLKFFSGENRLRSMGDDLCCCGVADLEGFKVNKCNFNHRKLSNDYTASIGQKTLPAGDAMHALVQDTKTSRMAKVTSFYDFMEMVSKSNLYNSIG